jgi:hypothetical protein
VGNRPRRLHRRQRLLCFPTAPRCRCPAAPQLHGWDHSPSPEVGRVSARDTIHAQTADALSAIRNELRITLDDNCLASTARPGQAAQTVQAPHSHHGCHRGPSPGRVPSCPAPPASAHRPLASQRAFCSLACPGGWVWVWHRAHSCVYGATPTTPVTARAALDPGRAGPPGGCTGNALSTRHRASSRNMPPARPVRAVRKKPTVHTDRPDDTDARPLHVRGCRNTSARGDGGAEAGCNFRRPRRVSAGWHRQRRHGQHVACTACRLGPMVAAVKPAADTAVVKGAMTPGGVLT